ncbi:hypothetical protein [Microbacterium sp. BH-3-3-3]|uniref:hypothetical protein n=1 Tax=Microbacterium sp. BH-3-3-3 TaxID=1906742 RepID=UPI0011A2F6CE|nr:hypothetical protein [Microbacterium sp. BH-3-3-3]
MKNYAGDPFQFQIGDKTYMIQEVGFADVERASRLQDLLKEDVEKGVEGIRDLIHAKSDKRTADAVMSLPPRKVIELIRDWVGITPGESQTSGDE